RISPSSGKTITVSKEQLQKLQNVKGIKVFSLVAEEKAFLQNGEYQSVAYMKGVDDNYRYVSGVADHLVKGDYDLGTADIPKLILGAGVENALGIEADKNIFTLQIYLPRRGTTELLDPMENISSDTIRTSAAFIIQQDFDNKYGITNIDFAKRALRFQPDEYSGIEIKVNDPSEADDIAGDVQKIFGKGYAVENRYQQNKNLYSVMNME